MKSINVLIAIVLLSATSCTAQIKNAKTETIKIYGNCEMCENTIEKAGNLKNIAKVDWNKDTKMAAIVYDPSKTNQGEILKRIALAGYDSDSFLAPDDVYNKLPDCCHYARAKKTSSSAKETQSHSAMVSSSATAMAATASQQASNPLKSVYEDYFALKDALVKSDGATAATKAQKLLADLKAVDMKTLASTEHNVWMKISKELMADADAIGKTKKVDQQRGSFDSLSDNMYKLIKVSNLEAPVYFQHCPMANDGAGANWLSKEIAVKNPYYGSAMLNCGKVVETIK